MEISPFIITFKTAIAATFVTFFLGIFLAYRVVRMKKFKNLADAIIILPMVLPPTVVGFFFNFNFRQAKFNRKIFNAVRHKFSIFVASGGNFCGCGEFAADV